MVIIAPDKIEMKWNFYWFFKTIYNICLQLQIRNNKFGPNVATVRVRELTQIKTCYRLK